MRQWLSEKWSYYESLPFAIQTITVMQYSLYTSIALYYTYLSFPNPLFDSNNPVFHGSYVHPMSWVFVLLFAIYVRYRLPLFADVNNVLRFEGSKYMEYWQYIYNLLFSFLIVCFAMAIIEGSWDIAITYYWFQHNMMSGITPSNFVLTYAFFLTGMGLIAGIMTKTYQQFKYIWIVPIALMLFYGIWLADGFHISTVIQYRYNIPTQIFELLHWGLVPGMFGILMALRGKPKTQTWDGIC